jgi:antitoxin HigA-1
MRSLRNPNRKPTHPGAILREDVLPALRMTQTEFAQRLGVSRLTVSEIVNEKRPVSVDMAIRLGKLLGNGAGLWLRLQQVLDVWELEQSGGYERIEPVEVKAA